MICPRMTLESTLLRRVRGRYKMNTKLLEGTNFRERLQQEWSKWKQQRKNIPKVWRSDKSMSIRKFDTFHDGRKREDTGRYNEGNLLLYLYLQHPARTDQAYKEFCQITPVEGQNERTAQQAASEYDGRCTGLYNVPGKESITIPSNRATVTARHSNDQRNSGRELESADDHKWHNKHICGHMRRKYEPIQVNDEFVEHMVNAG